MLEAEEYLISKSSLAYPLGITNKFRYPSTFPSEKYYIFFFNSYVNFPPFSGGKEKNVKMKIIKPYSLATRRS
jgi:hypothetical protein